MSDSRVTLYARPEEIKVAKEHKFNLSAIFRKALNDEIRKLGIDISEPEPELLYVVRCPFCRDCFQSTSRKRVTCKYCKRTFLIAPKNHHSPDIIKFVNGNRSMINPNLRNQIL